MPSERDPRTWNSSLYARSARYVSDLGVDVLKLLVPRPGERILDIGCGDGALTEKIAAVRADVVEALTEMLAARGISYKEVSPWYFPDTKEYTRLLEANGFGVDSIALIPRPTPIPGDIILWLENFGTSFLRLIPTAERTSALERLRGALRPRLCDAAGQWTVDYVRLRVAASLDKT